RRFVPETRARTGSWPAMKTSDLTMRPTVVPTAAAACSAVRVLSANSITVVCTPAAARATATFCAEGLFPTPFAPSAASIAIFTGELCVGRLGRHDALHGDPRLDPVARHGRLDQPLHAGAIMEARAQRPILGDARDAPARH